MRRAPLVVLALVGLAGPATAAGRPVLVELFTSQSCSSCPPAEALLADLAGEPDLLPLAFHVTYWNHLHWRDTYSLPAATARQEGYAARLGAGTYTPQAVVDGRAELVGSDAAGLRGAITRARSEVQAAVPVTVARVGSGLAVTVGPGEGRGILTLVGFDPSRTTAVARGENAGRTLVQANVVRAVREIGTWAGSETALSTPLLEGADAAVILQAHDGRVLGLARLGLRS